jgi:hypothetical protein
VRKTEMDVRLLLAQLVAIALRERPACLKHLSRALQVVHLLLRLSRVRGPALREREAGGA